MQPTPYASRPASTRSGSKPDALLTQRARQAEPLELAERASKADGLTDVDLNYPADHLGGGAQSASARPSATSMLNRERLGDAVLFQSGLQEIRRLH